MRFDTEPTAFGEVIEYAIGGGWGNIPTESPKEDEQVVRVIRGTDIPAVQAGSLGNSPVRTETKRKAEKRFLKDGDIVLEISGGSAAKGQTTGRTCLITSSILNAADQPLIPASFCRLVRLKSSIVLPSFAYYWLQDMYKSGRAGKYENRSTGISNFQFKVFLERERLPLPSLKEQKQIARTLSAIDEKIANNLALAADLESMVRTIFKSWFVDFDPVRAKMEGGRPAGMDAEIAALFPDELVESELGLIPKGWEVRPIGELIDSSLGGDWGKEVPETDHTERCAIVRGTDLSGLAHCDVSSIPVRYVTAKKLAKRQFESWDIVFEVSGGSKDQSTGRSLLLRPDQIQALGSNSCCASFCRRFRFENDGKAIWMGVFLDKSYRDGLMWRYQVQSTGISNFQTKVFLEKHLVVEPPQPLLDAFAQLVKPMLEASSISENQGLAELRDTLLPRLISGKLSLTEVSEELEAV